MERVTTPQDWTIETRRRLTGKLKGHTYKVYIDSEGRKEYSLPKAKAKGFDGSDEVPDGRTKRGKAAKAKAKQKK